MSTQKISCNIFLVELAKTRSNGLLVELEKISGVNGFPSPGSEEIVD